MATVTPQETIDKANALNESLKNLVATTNKKSSIFKKARKMVDRDIKKLENSSEFEKARKLLNMKKNDSLKKLLKNTNAEVLQVQLNVAEKLAKMDQSELSPKQKRLIKRIKNKDTSDSKSLVWLSIHCMLY